MFHRFSVSLQNEFEGLQGTGAHRLAIAASRRAAPGFHGRERGLIEAASAAARLDLDKDHRAGLIQLAAPNHQYLINNWRGRPYAVCL
jgi:hypothetical protein